MSKIPHWRNFELRIVTFLLPLMYMHSQWHSAPETVKHDSSKR